MDKRRFLGRCGFLSKVWSELANSGGSFLIIGIEFRLVNIFRLSPESLLPELNESLLPEDPALALLPEDAPLALLAEEAPLTLLAADAPLTLLAADAPLTELLLLIGRESEDAFSLSSEPPKLCPDLLLVRAFRLIAAFLPKDISLALRINPGRGFPLAPTVTLRFCFAG